MNQLRTQSFGKPEEERGSTLDRHAYESVSQRMNTIEVIRWGEATGGTAWDAHPEVELKSRMLSGMELSRSETKRLWKSLCNRGVISLESVRGEAVLGITQILRSMGAEFTINLESGNDEQLFKKWPKRGIS